MAVSLAATSDFDRAPAALAASYAAMNGSCSAVYAVACAAVRPNAAGVAVIRVSARA